MTLTASKFLPYFYCNQSYGKGRPSSRSCDAEGLLWGYIWASLGIFQESLSNWFQWGFSPTGSVLYSFDVSGPQLWGPYFLCLLYPTPKHPASLNQQIHFKQVVHIQHHIRAWRIRNCGPSYEAQRLSSTWHS